MQIATAVCLRSTVEQGSWHFIRFNYQPLMHLHQSNRHLSIHADVTVFWVRCADWCSLLIENYTCKRLNGSRLWWVISWLFLEWVGTGTDRELNVTLKDRRNVPRQIVSNAAVSPLLLDCRLSVTQQVLMGMLGNSLDHGSFIQSLTEATHWWQCFVKLYIHAKLLNLYLCIKAQVS